MDKKTRLYLTYSMGIYQLVSAFSPWLIPNVFNGKFVLASDLPLEMCGLSGILAGIVIFYRNQILFEFLYFWGICGFIHSIISPEFTGGDPSNFQVFDYYVGHSMIFIVPVWLMVFMGRSLTKGALWRIALYTQPVLLFVGTINWLVGGNYMYLAEAPIANNPLILTREWPWYILLFEFLMIIHFILLYLPAKKSSVSST